VIAAQPRRNYARTQGHCRQAIGAEIAVQRPILTPCAIFCPI
jgi:hypothetical protein